MVSLYGFESGRPCVEATGRGYRVLYNKRIRSCEKSSFMSRIACDGWSANTRYPAKADLVRPYLQWRCCRCTAWGITTTKNRHRLQAAPPSLALILTVRPTRPRPSHPQGLSKGTTRTGPTHPHLHHHTTRQHPSTTLSHPPFERMKRADR
jgi:hypothetical protein